MKILLLVPSLFLSLALEASEQQLNCTAELNYEKLQSAQLTVESEQSNLRWGEYKQFRFLVSRKSNNVELQLFDGNEPSRSYAITDFSKTNTVELTIWKNEFLLSLKCEKP